MIAQLEKLKSYHQLAEFTVTPLIDHIQWYVNDYDTEKGGLVSHEDFREWVEKEGLLKMESVSYELADVIQWEISYTDFLMEDNLKHYFFKYLIENQIL